MLGFRRKRLDSDLIGRISAFIDRTFVDEDGAVAAAEPSFSADARDNALPSFDLGDAFYGAPMESGSYAPAAPPAPDHTWNPTPAPEKPAHAGHSMTMPQMAVPKAAGPRRMRKVEAEEAPAKDLASWLDQLDEPFSTTLLELIDRKGMTDVQVYKRAHMSRQLFSRIRSDAGYRPAKKTVLALAIALRLSLDETRSLLERAGFALSHASKRDVIVEYFIANADYDLFAVNEALYEFDQPLL